MLDRFDAIGYDKHGTEAERIDEAIVPADLNLIYAQDLRAIINEYLPQHSRFTMIAGKSSFMLPLPLLLTNFPLLQVKVHVCTFPSS